MDEDGNVVAEYRIYRSSNTKIKSGEIPIGYTVEIYDAELVGATEGLKAAAKHIMSKFATNVEECLGNEEAAIRLHTVSKNYVIYGTTHNRLLTPVASPSTVIVRWIYGHASITGNGRADSLAKIACNKPSYALKPPSKGQRGKMPEELCFLTQRNLLLSARSAYGDFAAYHRRFKNEDATLLRDCGEENSLGNPFTRYRMADIRKPGPRLFRGPEGDIKWVFRTTAWARAFGNWYKRAQSDLSVA
ncbi:hypothetical protein EPUL_003782 [Erysiphe pulchra]|uniref:Uncharacterized protein n=1 Tax=Erysiphe pulchra TaxID=225359 RepID=A0A2S4PQC7_9PEZI|nr:hypothetical protein EPUL_003782 [Erysiphe pulchra]